MRIRNRTLIFSILIYSVVIRACDRNVESGRSETEPCDNRLYVINRIKVDYNGLFARYDEEMFPELVADVAHPLKNELGEIGESPETVITKESYKLSGTYRCFFGCYV